MNHNLSSKILINIYQQLLHLFSAVLYRQVACWGGIYYPVKVKIIDFP